MTDKQRDGIVVKGIIFIMMSFVDTDNTGFKRIAKKVGRKLKKDLKIMRKIDVEEYNKCVNMSNTIIYTAKSVMLSLGVKPEKLHISFGHFLKIIDHIDYEKDMGLSDRDIEIIEERYLGETAWTTLKFTNRVNELVNDYMTYRHIDNITKKYNVSEEV